MDGIYTQNRNLKQKHESVNGSYLYEQKLLSDSDVSTSNAMTRRYSQTTTSFRSSDPNGSLNEYDPRQFLALNSESFNRVHDRGHEFSTRKGKLILSHPDWNIRGRGSAFWRGPLTLSVPEDDIPGVDRDYDFGPIDLTYGTKAIRQTTPTKAAANITQLLVETLRDLPRLPGLAFAKGPLVTPKVYDKKTTSLNQSGLISGSADEYLNLVFGWSPTVSDVLKICRAIVHADDIIAQYVRDSGRVVRRRWEFAQTQSTRLVSSASNVQVNGTSTLSYFVFPWAHDFFANPEVDAYGTASLTETKTERYWFSGAYSYYLSEVLSPGGKLAYGAQIARKLLGVDGLTIDLAYQLAPYSWLLDYFTNVGDVLANVSAFSRDSLVLRWGYLMRETRVVRSYSHSGIRPRSGPTGPILMNEIFDQKLRVRATPYGFGLNPAEFTTQQWAILAALGMTRHDRALL
jgi:hypothetical protein